MCFTTLHGVTNETKGTDKMTTTDNQTLTLRTHLTSIERHRLQHAYPDVRAIADKIAFDHWRATHGQESTLNHGCENILQHGERSTPCFDCANAQPIVKLQVER